MPGAWDLQPRKCPAGAFSSWIWQPVCCDFPGVGSSIQETAYTLPMCQQEREGEIIEVYFICWRINLYFWREEYGISLCPLSIYAYISVSEINLPLLYTQTPDEWDGQYLTSLCWITVEQHRSSTDRYKIVHSTLGNVLTWISSGASARTPEKRWWSNYSYLRDADGLQSQCFGANFVC